VLALAVLASVLVGAPFASAQTGTDLSVTIVADRSTANAGRVITYTITVSNLGGTTATGVSLFVVAPTICNVPGERIRPESLTAVASVTVSMTATAIPCGLSITGEATVSAQVSATGDSIRRTTMTR
jgi:hypothetical protein